MRIIRVDNYRDFLGLKEIWNDTLLRCKNTSVFSTWEWLSIWWRHFGKDKKLMILLAEDDNGKIIGIAPLMYSVHKMFGLRRGKIAFIGTPDSDYNDFILVEKENKCIKLFINHLKNFSETWDCIDLSDIPENSKALPYLRKIAKGIKPLHKCPYLPLPESFDMSVLYPSSKQRKDLRRNLKRLENSFKVEFIDCSRPQLLDSGMNLFFELHQRRWNSKGISGAFADPQVRSFHISTAKLFSQKKWLGLFILKLSSETVAALYGFCYKSKFLFYLSGFDPKFSKYSVGNLLIMYAIATCIEEGLTEFDFMRGSEEYKDRWNTKARWNYQVVLTREGTIASLRHRLYNEYWHQGKRLKYLFKMKNR